MLYQGANRSPDMLLSIYQKLLYPRMVEEKMLILLRQGRIGKWFSGIGQEAIAVGSSLAMNASEYILPMHRNLGVFTTRNIPLEKLVAQWQGKATGFTKGRDRSFHFGTQEHKIIGMISHLGPQLALAAGIALADRLAGRPHVTLVFTGEGATSEGDFHEALNVAAVWDLPVIFLVENNGYGLSTPVTEQYRCERISDKAAGYGMEGLQIDGNNVLEVFDTVNRLAQELRVRPRPVLLECMTFRMRGHEEASGTKYVPPELLEHWAAKDPLTNYENYLLQTGVLTPGHRLELRAAYKKEIDESCERGFAAPEPVFDAAAEEADMYVPYVAEETGMPQGNKAMRYIDAISDALREGLKKHPELVLMGQDIAEYGGAFKITEGFVTEFGRDRIRNTPICESAIVGAGLGLSINGAKALVEMQFADFVSCGFNQVVNNLAKTHYRWGEKADVVIRMPAGAGTGAGPFHSQSNEAWFTKTPGLKVVYPAFPKEAKGLLLSALADPNPVLYFEHKLLYRSLTAGVPEGYFLTPIGQAAVLRTGKQFSIITYGLGVHWALAYLQQHPEADAFLVDLQTLQPWDKDTVAQAVRATGRVLVLHEDTLTCGFGAEIAAWIGEHCFRDLDAPVIRCASLDTAIPMNKDLEAGFLAESRLAEKIATLLAF
ncbi:dehydrogenase [Pedobacter yulinensis]|uniref:3-methyl-2-oxobutanoate dehydrogenase (2-methylpropanoyl-transferring) n=1 Tax=Pedobacter yulinensis TaxID=2126353 RepID=A0A2T3HP40_9SPHI|nr:alpha-ketoacid dehydrogenase subunit alpha/beta [Pedobacter yulinensis]PST84214.1 dehydrogenase [Pedobacter yulinensis]